jgi:hypothetical protein
MDSNLYDHHRRANELIREIHTRMPVRVRRCERRQLQVSRAPEKERGEGQLSFSLFGALVVG